MDNAKFFVHYSTLVRTTRELRGQYETFNVKLSQSRDAAISLKSSETKDALSKKNADCLENRTLCFRRVNIRARRLNPKTQKSDVW